MLEKPKSESLPTKYFKVVLHVPTAPILIVKAPVLVGLYLAVNPQPQNPEELNPRHETLRLILFVQAPTL